MLSMTPNQVVAYNVRAARRLRGWTQEESAERLELHLGERWSKASFSAAEQSVEGKRVRQFSADDIYALARTFELPPQWFLLPPPYHSTVISAKPAPDFDEPAPPEVIRMIFSGSLEELGSELYRRAGGEPVAGAIHSRASEVVRDHVIGWVQLLVAQTMRDNPAATDERLRFASSAVEALNALVPPGSSQPPVGYPGPYTGPFPDGRDPALWGEAQ